MTTKELVIDFYKSDVLINCEVMKQYLYQDVIIDWNNSNGFLKLNYRRYFRFFSGIKQSVYSFKSKNQPYCCRK